MTGKFGNRWIQKEGRVREQADSLPIPNSGAPPQGVCNVPDGHQFDFLTGDGEGNGCTQIANSVHPRPDRGVLRCTAHRNSWSLAGPPHITMRAPPSEVLAPAQSSIDDRYTQFDDGVACLHLITTDSPKSSRRSLRVVVRMPSTGCPWSGQVDEPEFSNLSRRNLATVGAVHFSNTAGRPSHRPKAPQRALPGVGVGPVALSPLPCARLSGHQVDQDLIDNGRTPGVMASSFTSPGPTGADIAGSTLSARDTESV